MQKVELLAPAGDLEKLKIAVIYGADAVFIGGRKFSLRSRASNFTLDDIKQGCDFAHKYGAKVHVTCNIVMHNNDLDGVKEYLLELEQAGVDAIIASSLFIIKTAIKYTKMEVHVSTQQSTLSSSAIRFYESLDVNRVVLGRELTLKEIKEIRNNTSLDLEVFIHGGMCASYSGRCMLSNVLTNRDANRGGCAHSCRWRYDLFQDGKKINPDGDYFAMSSKDLCAIRAIPSLIDTGINSFKIEGRMKSLHYIASIVKAYRKLIDAYYLNHKIDNYDYYESLIKKGENRLSSTGFLFGIPTVDQQLYDLNLSVPTKEFVGIVLSYDKVNKIAYIEQRNYFLPNTTIEVFGPSIDEEELFVGNIYDEMNNSVDACRHPKQHLHFYTEKELHPYDMLRLKDDKNDI